MNEPPNTKKHDELSLERAGSHGCAESWGETSAVVSLQKSVTSLRVAGQP